jgi:nucleoside-diphosphate kinase
MKKPHLSRERTLIVIKPDGVQRSLIGEIIRRYERVGLKLVGMKMMVLDESFIEKHYTLDPDWIGLAGEKSMRGAREKGHAPLAETPLEVGGIILERLKRYLASGPVIAMVWQGAHAIEIVRKLTGGTEPLSSAVGTIRGDLVLDSYQMSSEDGRAVRNLVHSSGSIKEAGTEIAHWFKKDELADYALAQERILYDVNLDGRSE